MSSDRRWWSIPKVFAFPLWPGSAAVDTADGSRPSRKAGGDRCSSDDEDIEEFLEKQRNARLGAEAPPPPPSSTKSNHKYSEDRTEGKRLSRSLSKRRSRSSSSKSSGSTKYSSFGKASDTDTEKAIKETIYEVTGSVPPISFSFFSDTEAPVADTERLYHNIDPVPEDEHSAIPDCDKGPSENVADENVTVDQADPETVDRPSTVESSRRTSPNSRERHITKLTILLSSVRNAGVDGDDAEAGDRVPVPVGDERPPKEECSSEDEADTAAEMPLYSVIDKKQPSRKNSYEKATQDVLDELNYAELSEFRGPAGNADAEVANMEYCNHRAKVKTRLRKISLRRKRGKVQPSLKKVNSRINNAWNSIRGWWQEEKTRLKQLRPKSFVAGEHADSLSCSEKSFYESIGHLNAIDEQNCSAGLLDEDGYCSLELKSESTEPDDRTDARNRRKSCMSDISTMSRHPPRPPPSRTSGGNAFRKSRYYTPQGQDGFEELRRYIKQGGDFCKELSVILQERSEAEIQYAKTLSKLSSKLLKASKEAVGTVGQAWHKAGVELETTSEIHKTFATALCEDVVKPLKQLLDSQHRIRKSVENAVDKTGKNLSEWRAAESKSKKQSFVSARENEKLQDVTLDVRLGGGLTGSNKLTASSLHLHQKQGNEKESSKLETKRKKAEELVKKSDVEYYTYCVRAERARLEWETAVVRGSQCFQALEEERLQQLKHLAFTYWQHCRDVGPKLTQSALRLKEPIENCDVNSDIKTIATAKGIEQPVAEQLLPDFYAEHTALAMNRERRRQALVKVLQLVVQDLERERRGKNGVENLARAFKQSPNFGSDDSQQNVSEKLHHMRFMLTYLEAARYKISCALAELDGKPKPSHPLATHIHVIRDRQGFQQSILKVPPWVHKETSIEPSEHVESPDWTDRGTADGNSVQPDSDFDEFSSQSSSEKDFESNMFTVMPESAISTPTPSAGGKCRALYHYTANLYDELNLQPGDVINIHDKQPDGWWLGELNGVVGIFPATYVEEIS